ncbi:MAG: cytochrome b [Pseudomonadota bacterium]
MFSTNALAAGRGDTPPGMLPHFDSWIALAMIVTSVATAWLLNVSAPKVRVMGTVLAAFGCFAIFAWFIFFVTGTGFLENPKPYQTPMDAAKPALLWTQASIALIAGFILLAVAYRQSKSDETLVLPSTNEPERYGRVSRILHWTTAILFISLIPMGIFASIIPEDVWYRTEYNVVHKTIGVLIFGLLIFRLFWNRQSKRPALDASLKPWERKLAHSAHVALYVMMIAVPLTGFIMTSSHGYPTFFFIWEFQPLWDESQTMTIIWGTMHKYLLPYLLYIILGAHILGALKHQFIDKHDSAFKRMVS